MQPRLSLLGSSETPSLQSAVESTAIRGTIDKIKVLTAGTDYVANDAVVVITGDGAGCAASPVINVRGEITGITVIAPGVGYTFADITITQTLGSGSGATFRSVLSPRFGHGANPQKELFAKNVAVNVSFINDNQDIVVGDVLSSDPPAGNDFRQIGIVKNIQNFAQTANFTDVVGTRVLCNHCV